MYHRSDLSEVCLPAIGTPMSSGMDSEIKNPGAISGVHGTGISLTLDK